MNQLIRGICIDVVLGKAEFRNVLGAAITRRVRRCNMFLGMIELGWERVLTGKGQKFFWVNVL